MLEKIPNNLIMILIIKVILSLYALLLIIFYPSYKKSRTCISVESVIDKSFAFCRCKKKDSSTSFCTDCMIDFLPYLGYLFIVIYK